MKPMPPSLVAEPPMPIVMSREPASRAALSSSPVPYEVVSSGSLFSSGMSVRPEADAISITALPSSKSANFASTGSMSGPCTSTVRGFASAEASTASTVPSPPSARAIFTVSTSPNTARAASPSSSAMRADSSVPLKESLANTNFICLQHLPGCLLPMRGYCPP